MKSAVGAFSALFMGKNKKLEPPSPQPEIKLVQDKTQQDAHDEFYNSNPEKELKSALQKPVLDTKVGLKMISGGSHHSILSPS